MIKKIQSNNQSQKTEQQKIKSETWFVRIYSFWRLLLPDTLIAWPLLSWIFQIQTPPKNILKLNIILQLIRALLFVGFAILYTF